MHNNKLANFTVALFTIVAIAPFIITSFFNYPAADDYSFSYGTHEALETEGIGGLMPAAVSKTIERMMNWQGSYTGSFLGTIQPAIFGEGWYAIVAPVMMAFAFVGIFAIVRALSVHVLNSKSRAYFGVSVLVWVYFLTHMPSPVEGLFWYDGALYTPFWSGAFVVVALMIGYWSREKASVKTIVVASLVAFLVGGGNAMIDVGMICVLAFIAFYCIKQKQRYLALIPVFISVVALLIVVFSPGTAYRVEALDNNLPLIWVLIDALKATVSYFEEWVDLPMLCLFVALLPFLARILDKSEGVSVKFSAIRFWFFVLLSVLFVFGLMCVPFYALGVEGPPRLTNTVFAVMLILLVVCWSFLIITLAAISNELVVAASKFLQEHVAASLLTLIMCLAIIVPCSHNWWIATKELCDGTVLAYSSQMEERLDLLNDTSIKELTLEPIRKKPFLLYFSDIKDDPSHWLNTSLARYYHKEQIKLLSE